MTGLHHDPHAIDSANSALDLLSTHSSALRYATVLTDDGFEVAARRGEAVANGDRFASIASSLQALGEAAVRELHIGAASSVIVSAESGYIVQVRVDGSTLVLAALFGGNETLGHALTFTRRAAADLGEKLTRRAVL